MCGVIQNSKMYTKITIKNRKKKYNYFLRYKEAYLLFKYQSI